MNPHDGPRDMQRIVLSLFVVALFAGCTDEPEPEAEAVGPTVITDPEDYTYVGNATLDNGGHIHDYWSGQDRLTIIDQTQQAGIGFYGAQGVTMLVFRPDDGIVVPQGAASMELTFSWTDGPTDQHGDFELHLQTAADNQPEPYAILENGGLVTIPLTNDQNDLPHQLLSAWEFHIVGYLPEPGLTGRWLGTGTLQAEAVRGLDIPVYPAHPDPWLERGAAGEIMLIDEERTTTLVTQDPIINGCFGQDGCMYLPYDLLPGAVVPLDTARVRVELEWDPTAPTSLALLVHPADTREWTAPTPIEDQDGRRVYEIEVSGVMGDGPYALQSLWEFNVFIDDPSMMFSGSYSMYAVAQQT